MDRKTVNTHAFKATSYDIGRPTYPEVFFDYLYKEVCFNLNSVIADIGAGTGKITRRFLEKGNKVFAVEPDKDMMKILKNNLSQFSNLIPIENTAENTEILANSIDLIFCGNSYHWFERKSVIPEMKRIIGNNKNQFNIVIASLGPCYCSYTDEFLEIEKRFVKSVPNRTANTSHPFQQGMFVNKTFEYVVYDRFTEFLNGSLSASSSPTPEEDCFDEYCQSLRRLFEKYCVNEKIESKFKLSCTIGNVDNLVQ